VVSFNWTPGHASIKGNEIADQLVKEAAKEAEALEVTTQVFTKQDIRKAARDVVMKKWQVRWDSSNSGRHYYRFHKVLKDKVKKYLPNKRLYTVINSLRTGYSKLNAYQFHLNQHLKNDKCEHCNQREDVEHYLLNCIKYENERERLLQKLYFIRGNIKLDLDILLEVNSPDMENILPALAEFIEETDRF
jgi:hypothetical protein